MTSGSASRRRWCLLLAAGALLVALSAGGAEALGRTEPSTAGDGTRLAVRIAKDPLEGARAILTRVNDDLVYRLVVRDLAANTVEPLARAVRNASPGSPVWSSDGSNVAFVGTGIDGRHCVFVVPDRRHGPPASARCVVAVKDDGPPFWSPVGRALSFGAYNGESRPVIYRVNVDGSRLVRVVAPPPGSRSALDDSGFSPDGRQLLYVEWRRMGRLEDGVGPALLKTVPVSGGRARTIVDGRRDKADAYIWEPAWSPDGRLIAYLNSCWLPESQGICRLAVVGRDGTARTQLPMRGSGRGDVEWGGLSFAWRPRLQTLLYAYGQPGAGGTVRSAPVYEVLPGTGRTRVVARFTCPWPGCTNITPQIMAVSSDGAYAVFAVGFAREQPELTIMERSYLLDLANGSVRPLPTLMSTGGPDMPYSNSAAVYLP